MGSQLAYGISSSSVLGRSKHLFNNQDTQGYKRQDVVWGGVDIGKKNVLVTLN